MKTRLFKSFGAWLALTLLASTALAPTSAAASSDVTATAGTPQAKASSVGERHQGVRLSPAQVVRHEGHTLVCVESSLRSSPTLVRVTIARCGQACWGVQSGLGPEDRVAHPQACSDAPY
jgi:hypothetical protein